MELNLKGLDRVRRWERSVRVLKGRTTEACAWCGRPLWGMRVHLKANAFRQHNVFYQNYSGESLEERLGG